MGRFSERSFLGKWGAIFLVSLFVEILQYIFGIGATDITDIINTSGGLMGLLLYHAFQKNERRQDVVSLFFGGFLLFFTFILLLH